jgi:hypothetical protein
MKVNVSADFKKVISRVKQVQGKLQTLLERTDWVDEARKYAEVQGKEVKKLLSGDLAKVKNFIERERKELERFQKEIPGEVKKFKGFIEGQRKELEKLLSNVRKMKSKSRKKSGTRKASAKKAT